MDAVESIFLLADNLEKAAERLNRKSLDELEDVAKNVAKSFGGSWLGYHSRVYYENLQPAPPGARFDSDWGFGEQLSSETRGKWGEFDFDAVVQQIMEWAGNPDKDKLESAALKAHEAFEDAQSRLLSVISRYRTNYPDDTFLAKIAKSIEAEKNISYSALVALFRPKSFHTHDTVAAHQGIQTPPHFHVIALVGTWRHPFKLCSTLAKQARRAGSHIEGLDKQTRRKSRIGTHIFIGHGQSPVWKDFRDFVRDRLNLPWDEFNRVPVAGIPTSSRLIQMLDEAAIAFLIFTAEDEQADGSFHPRMNVLHEAGLFQGRLGLERAIILLEDGCQEFSNSHGVGHIKFSRGNIKETFEEVRRVLEREEIIGTTE